MYEFNNNDDRFLVQQGEYEFQINDNNNNNNSFENSLIQRKNENIQKALEKFMPIGSIVKINDRNELLMIVGYNYVNNNQKSDYIGCIYPYGLSNNLGLLNFNHNQIKSIYYVGYINRQQQLFQEELNNNENGKLK